MITLRTSRQYVEAAVSTFFPFIEMLKQTKLNDLAHKDPRSDEYMSAVAINCILEEVQKLFRRKLFNTTGPKIKFEFTDAQGIVLYKTLPMIPFDREKIYLGMLISEWIQLLDQELLKIYIQRKSCVDY